MRVIGIGWLILLLIGGAYEEIAVDGCLFKNALVKTFSTEQAAKEYVFNNKPCLSLGDIKSILVAYWVNSSRKLDMIEIRRLEQVVSDKINK